ncbi:hypothetical protein TraAM80_03031 [Trypanosoma rangeli]|uniref:Uncharacterized protein n=1 Tax=Trypanosoma rangeli TaxID=5698 RepID=A0A3R7L5R9_TRYRA|nr:uncharacterized protein TraAM80_03031 [Trypanosoma rangeli]RNF08177.1 hypothetical protein TraAM80_03031 [Trypanosoma rangeli]|eukprot:RNF08177.1 hypothetical protein TraAM80_03031 [Trypanosoma rangeli]
MYSCEIYRVCKAKANVLRLHHCHETTTLTLFGPLFLFIYLAYATITRVEHCHRLMPVAEKLQRLQRAVDVNDGHIQRLRNELRLLDVTVEARRESDRQYTAQMQAEIRRLELDIAAIERLRRPAAAKHLVSSPPPLLLPTLPRPLAVPRDRLESAVADLEQQSERLASLRVQRQVLEELLRHAVSHYPQYNIPDLFDTRNELERIALERVMNAA